MATDKVALATIEANITVIPNEVYDARVDKAHRRAPPDVRDAPTMALALKLGCGIRTGDYDVFAYGVSVWTDGPGDTIEAKPQNRSPAIPAHPVPIDNRLDPG